jgi:uncharacterized protein (TIGR02145 family)
MFFIPLTHSIIVYGDQINRFHYLKLCKRRKTLNEKGTSYGEIISFETHMRFTDPRDDQSYEFVIIGSQTWMTQNLNYQTSNSWRYDNNTSYCDIYGRLYDRETIMNGEVTSNSTPSGVQGICPPGWHLPSDNEWKVLEIHLGMSQSAADGTNWRSVDEGEKIKSISGWSINGNGTNSSGFNALPAGIRSPNGSFNDHGFNCDLWSATEYSATYAWTRYLSYNNDKIYRYYPNKPNGGSVRCLKD